ncbi:transporter [Acinetobacter rudis]|uniref:Transporter n=1 Tax=Acinetobacter rudis TaxID=632955 RepID=A0AAW8JAM5_9GAMM|nr:transporter [Acinetobacter rudis]MDQ8936150.1 transporter [Acinetobacter rudis]MDQ8954294.1 transporter [Acinetobacter rudis]MDQ9018413.1 transporter [Acinetobacter rudis]
MYTNKILNRFTLLSCTLGLFIGPTQAMDLDAGDYDYAPSGTHLALLYYQHANRDALYQGSNKASGNNELSSDIGIARYVNYRDLGSIQIAPQILVPFGRLEAGKDLSNMGSSSGIGDVILANAFFLYHNPESKSQWGITPYLYLPTGQYSKHDDINLGENRFKLTLQSAYTTHITPKWAVDVAGDFTVYGKNDDAPKGGTLKQDIGYQVQGNTRYFLNDQVDLRAGISYSDAGKTKLNGVESASTKQSKFWLGAAYSPTPATNMIVAYGRDIDVENGFKEDQRINLRFMYAF